MAQKPYIIWSLSPKASKYESSEPQGKSLQRFSRGCYRSSRDSGLKGSRQATKSKSFLI